MPAVSSCEKLSPIADRSSINASSRPAIRNFPSIPGCQCFDAQDISPCTTTDPSDIVPSTAFWQGRGKSVRRNQCHYTLLRPATEFSRRTVHSNLGATPYVGQDYRGMRNPSVLRLNHRRAPGLEQEQRFRAHDQRVRGRGRDGVRGTLGCSHFTLDPLNS